MKDIVIITAGIIIMTMATIFLAGGCYIAPSNTGINILKR